MAGQRRLTPVRKQPLVVFGASTGGPGALKSILRALPRDDSLASLLSSMWTACSPTVWLRGLRRTHTARSSWPTEGRQPAPGKVLLADTNDHLIMDTQGRLCYTAEPREACFRPSVDVFFSSVAGRWPSPGVAVLLTGMGRDGAKGLLRLHYCGWHTIAQDQQSCVVWGMPRAAESAVPRSEILPLVPDSLRRSLPTVNAVR